MQSQEAMIVCEMQVCVYTIIRWNVRWWRQDLIHRGLHQGEDACMPWELSIVMFSSP